MTASEKANQAASTLETPCGIRIHRSERAEHYCSRPWTAAVACC